MKQLLPFLFCLVLLFACKDNEPVPVTPTPEPEIKQVCFCTEGVSDLWNGKSRFEYLYDNNDKLVRINYYIPKPNSQELSRLWSYNTFEYDERGNIIKLKIHVADTEEWAVAMETTYNNDGLLTEKKVYRLNAGYPHPNPVSQLTTYQYSPSLQLSQSQIEHKDDKGNATYAISSYSYEYDENDVLIRRSNQLLPTDSGYRSKSVLTFDGKEHPLSASPAYLKLTSENYNAIPIDKRYSNVLKSEYYDQYEAQGYVDRIYEHASFNVSIEYNAAGYPTKEIRSYLSCNIETYTYAYICK